MTRLSIIGALGFSFSLLGCLLRAAERLLRDLERLLESQLLPLPFFLTRAAASAPPAGFFKYFQQHNHDTFLIECVIASSCRRFLNNLEWDFDVFFGGTSS